MAGAAPLAPARRRPAMATASARESRSRSPPRWSPSRSAAAIGGAPDDDPWRPERAVWPLLEVIDASRGRAVVRPLAPRRDRRRAAGTPWPAGWPSCSAPTPPTGPSCCGPGGRASAGSTRDLAWQPELWRRLRARIGGPDPGRAARRGVRGPARRSRASPRCPRGCRCSAPPGCRRSSSPCSPRWPSTATCTCGCPTPRPRCGPRSRRARHGRGAAARRRPDRRRGRAPAAVLARARRARAAGAAHRGRARPRRPAPPAAPSRRPRCWAGCSGELRDDRPPVDDPAADGDRSVQVHACHGPDRQVEVLREVVLGLLEADPTLEPRDVLVMCPDIETFAPLISAAFGLGRRRPTRTPATAAGAAGRPGVAPGQPAARHRRPAAGAGRRPAHRRAGARPARRRARCAGASASTTTTSTGCASSPSAPGCAGASTPRTARPFRLEAFGQNTWSAGLDRLLLGVAMPGDADWLGTALPLARSTPATPSASVGSPSSSTGSRACSRELSGERPLAEWIGRARRRARRCSPPPPAEAWQEAQARAELADGRARRRARTPPRCRSGLADVRGLLAERLRGRPTRASFRTGTLTVATLVPMRSVPHRVVCLLGLDDGVFPRAGAVDGDDVLARDPLRRRARRRAARTASCCSTRSCAATEHLVVVHSGADERTGAAPPARGAARRAARRDRGHGRRRRPGRRCATRCSRSTPRNFHRTGRGAVQLRPRRAGRGPRGRRAAGAAAAVPARARCPRPAPGTVALDDLVALRRAPGQGLPAPAGRAAVSRGDEAPADALPGRSSDGLARGRSATGCCATGWRAATWTAAGRPSGGAASCRRARWATRCSPTCSTTSSRWWRRRAEYRGGRRRRPATSTSRCPTARRVVGTVGGRARARTLLRVEYSRLAPKQRLRAWVRLLALTAATGEPWRAVTVGRGAAVRASPGPARAGRAGRGARRCSPSWWRCARPGCASRCRCPRSPAHTYARVRRGGAARPTRWPRRPGRGRTARAPSAPTPPTAGLGPAPAPATVLSGEAGPPGGEPTRFGALALAPVVAVAARRRTWCADDCRSRPPGRVRRLRAAAHRHHRARGQRRHRQDVHDRRARRPLRRRGPRPRCPS